MYHQNIDKDIVPAAVDHDEHRDHGKTDEADDVLKGQAVQMMTSLDTLTVWQALRVYKKVAIIAMIAAFSASLDGYQINLNGSIVANKGFIRLMEPDPTVTAVRAPYVSAWGGIQSAGQFVGQVALPYFTDWLGRKWALYIIWIIVVGSVFIESFVSSWQMWLGAKLLAGVGVGAMQATVPMYISELSPSQLRGFLINAYSLWFVVGQLMAPVALQQLNVTHPLDFKVAIYTQWAMIGLLAVIYVWLPESPWWLVSKGRADKAQAVLSRLHSDVPNYNVHEEMAVMFATVEEERRFSAANAETGQWAIIKGTNGWRLLIGLWPKLMQQFVGLVVFNTYSTYFFQLAGNKDPFKVTVILACVQLIGCLLVAVGTDAVGRRPFTIYGYAVTVVSVLCLGIVGCFDYTSPALGSLLIFFACIATFSTTGASAIGYAYLAEIPQQTLRAKAAGWGLAITNLFAIMFSFVAPIMLKGSGNFAGWNVKTGFFFAGTGAVVVVVGWFILPEVARRTPAEIDEMFEKKVNPRKFKTYRTEVQANLEEKERVQAMASV